jgi:hypothetical protein
MTNIAKILHQKTTILLSRGIFCVFSLTGIILTIQGDPSLISSLSYYTIQSNILALFVVVLFFVRDIQGKPNNTRWLLLLKGAATVALFLTFIVFHFALRPVMTGTSMESYIMGIGNVLVHYVAPWWFLLDHFLFDQKGSYLKTDPFLFLSIPTLYYIYVNLYSAFGGVFVFGDSISPYPYYFLNPALVGGGWGVVLMILLILVLMTILGFGFIGLDRLFIVKKKR